MLENETEVALRRLSSLKDEEIDLAGAALTLAARGSPGAPIDHYHAHLAEVVLAVANASAEAGDSLIARRAALSRVLHETYEYAGDQKSYDDLQNANLMRVIDRRKGLPIALGILHIHCGRALGWDVCGLDFPGHFLIRLSDGTSRMILDPFNGGEEINADGLRWLLKATQGPDAELRPAHYAPATNRGILIRLQNNRKVRLIKTENLAGALAVVEEMLLFAPRDATLWHDAGLLNRHIGNLRAALVAFGHCRDLADNRVEWERFDQLIAEICGRLN
ncbi:MAG TPA: hypothetical protein DIT35_05720 [Rhodospirillaceae bacterium]|nr:hypothetical protein [Rhodospirillaceae bacterium]